MKNRFFSLSLRLLGLLAILSFWASTPSTKPDLIPSRSFHACFLPKARAFGPVCTQHLHLGDSSLPQVNKKFLIQLHIVRDSLGMTLTNAEVSTVRNSVADASSAFSDIGISFETEDSVRIVDNYRFNRPEDTWRLDEMVKNHAVADRINLFVFEAFAGVLDGAAGIASGESMFLPYASLENSGTVTHELGHVFGLAHTFGAGDVIASAQGEPFDASMELVDGSNCETTGDQICDTPADPYIPNDPNGTVWIDGNCVYIYDGRDANGDYYEPDIDNIMAYYFPDDPCYCNGGFSRGQLRKMAASYNRNDWW
ncbi:MAG: hypothetical protein R8G66_23320 [Cytophagales bacterium]|nr:hypothetical protein [Cytophagales bacterium]